MMKYPAGLLGSKAAVAVLMGIWTVAACADIRPVTPASREAKGWWKTRHADKLAEIRAASTNGGFNVVFLGDSITEFWESKPIFRSHWSATFGKNPAYRALNLGYSGDCTQNLLWRIRNGELDGFEAKALVLMIGTNNGEPAMEVICGIRSVIDAAFEKQPRARMVLCAIFPRGADATDPRRLRNDLVNRELRKFCDGRRIIWCDFRDRFLTADGRLSSEVMPDHLHPCLEGYAIWANSILPSLNEILAPHGAGGTFVGRVPDRWLLPVCEGPLETIPASRVQAANNRWTDGFYGSRWWLSRVEQARDYVQYAKGRLDLIMLGDSITHFWQQNHPEHWRRFVGDRKIANFGCAGDTVQNVLWMIENGALDGCTARVVSILAGTNNNTDEGSHPDRVAEGLKKAVRLTREKQPDAKIVLTAIFPRGASAKDVKHLEARRRNEATNAILKDFAAKEANVIWLDLTAKFLGSDGFVPKEMMADRIHPTETGYDIWAAELDRIMSDR